MAKALDLTGHTYGRLTVKEYAGQSETKGGAKKRNWLCDCSCGKELVVTVSALRSGNTTSCGCYDKERRIKHGLADTRFYSIWEDMKSRCDNVNNESYVRYGGRGITYNPKWKDFIGFKEDMFSSYSDELTLERVDPNKDYVKENCEWVTKSEQARNRTMMSSNKTGVSGVRLWTDSKNGNQYYVAEASYLNVYKSKHYSVNKHGESRAFELAVSKREQFVQELNALGAGFSQFHGGIKEFK